MAERPPEGSAEGALDSYGWSDEVGHLLAGLDGTAARVVRTDRGAVLVATHRGLQQIGLHQGLDLTPVAGDWLTIAGEPPRIVRVAPRRNALVRRDAHSSQALASNVDDVFVLCGLDRPVLEGLLDRALVAACDSSARPLVVLTKADLCADVEGVRSTVAAHGYGVDVIATSSLDGRGLDDVRVRLGRRRTVVLLGESGVGKSSLVNALLSSTVQTTGEVRTRDRQGRHTTRARHLVPIGGGSVVIDTPGLRTFGVVGMDGGLARLFADVAAMGRGCRFTDCTHTGEPDCAMDAAVATGALDPARAERYRRLVDAVRVPAGRGRSRSR